MTDHTPPSHHHPITPSPDHAITPSPDPPITPSPHPDPEAVESAYAQFFRVSPFPSVVSRLQDHRVVAINASTAELIGVSEEQAIGSVVTDYYVNPAERVQLAERLRHEGRADSLRLQIKRPNGDRSGCSPRHAWSHGMASRRCSPCSMTSAPSSPRKPR